MRASPARDPHPASFAAVGREHVQALSQTHDETAIGAPVEAGRILGCSEEHPLSKWTTSRRPAPREGGPDSLTASSRTPPPGSSNGAARGELSADDQATQSRTSFVASV